MNTQPTNAPLARTIWQDSAGRNYYVCDKHSTVDAIESAWDTFGMVRENGQLVGDSAVRCQHPAHQ